jgi:hypothetical protein
MWQNIELTVRDIQAEILLDAAARLNRCGLTEATIDTAAEPMEALGNPSLTGTG